MFIEEYTSSVFWDFSFSSTDLKPSYILSDTLLAQQIGECEIPCSAGTFRIRIGYGGRFVLEKTFNFEDGGRAYLPVIITPKRPFSRIKIELGQKPTLHSFLNSLRKIIDSGLWEPKDTEREAITRLLQEAESVH